LSFSVKGEFEMERREKAVENIKENDYLFFSDGSLYQ
jgi:hypothetical protein